MKNTSFLWVLTSLILVIVIFGCTETNPDEGNNDNQSNLLGDSFVLTAQNFEFVTIQYTAQDVNVYQTQIQGLDSSCNTYKGWMNDSITNTGEEWVTVHGFYVMYNVVNVNDKFLQTSTDMLIEPLSCSLTIDGETYFKLDSYEVGVVNRYSQEFCAPAVMSTKWQSCVEPTKRPSANFTVDHTVTLCCDDICKTKILPVYCK